MRETDQEILTHAKDAGGRISISRHARERMDERGVRVPDLLRAIATADRAVHQARDDGRDSWKLVGGVDTDGDDLVVVVGMHSGVPRVVTVF